MGFRGRLLVAITMGLSAGALIAVLARSSGNPVREDAGVPDDARPTDSQLDAAVREDAAMAIDAGVVVDRRARAHELDLVGQNAMKRTPIDTATAIRSFEKSYALDPDPRVLFNLATANFMAGNCARAHELYQQLLSKVPADSMLAEKAKRGLGFKCD